MSPSVRRGLPRREGEGPWPSESAIAGLGTDHDGPAATSQGEGTVAATSPEATWEGSHTVADAATVPVDLRAGLVRRAGGSPWPDADRADVPYARAALLVPGLDGAASSSGSSAPPEVPQPRTALPSEATVARESPSEEPTVLASVDAETELERDARLLAASTVTKRAPRRLGRFTIAQWLGGGLFVLLGSAVFVAAMVMLARRVVAMDEVVAFMERYPGQAPRAEASTPGMPVWVNLQHFFNLFLIALIVQSGLRVRRERTPPAYWTSTRSGAPRKVSLVQWLHQALTVLWVVNGAIFVVLLFVTSHGLRIVPTSPDVFANAASAALQYASLDWPVESGWVSYNALQQLAYFTTVFVAAPVAILSGYRLSTVWPATPTWPSRVFPAGVARAVHFPTMVYFVGFIVVHVALVLSTGLIRNLNVMFAARDDSQSLVGFVLFVAAIAVTALAAALARPSLIAPLARPFGSVTRR